MGRWVCNHVTAWPGFCICMTLSLLRLKKRIPHNRKKWLQNRLLNWHYLQKVYVSVIPFTLATLQVSTHKILLHAIQIWILCIVICIWVSSIPISIVRLSEWWYSMQEVLNWVCGLVNLHDCEAGCANAATLGDRRIHSSTLALPWVAPCDPSVGP